MVSWEQYIFYQPFLFHPYFTPRRKKADGSGFFLRLICSVLADELSNYQCHSADNYFYLEMCLYWMLWEEGIYLKRQILNKMQIPTILVSDILRIVSYNCALQSSSSIFLLLSAFTGWNGCQTISNLVLQYY